MLSSYLDAAMTHAIYGLLEDGTYYGEIDECPGVWANETHLEACRAELLSVLEDWILIRISDHLFLPVIDGLELKVESAA